MVSKQAHIPVEGSKRGSPVGQRMGKGGLSNTQNSRTDSYSLCFQKSKNIYSPPERLQGFWDQSFPRCWKQSFTHFRTASSVPALEAGDHYSLSAPDCSGLTAARTRPPTHRPLCCQDTQHHFSFHGSPRSCRHIREPSLSSCCKTDLSMPWISPRETGLGLS